MNIECLCYEETAYITKFSECQQLTITKRVSLINAHLLNTLFIRCPTCVSLHQKGRRVVSLPAPSQKRKVKFRDWNEAVPYNPFVVLNVEISVLIIHLFIWLLILCYFIFNFFIVFIFDILCVLFSSLLSIMERVSSPHLWLDFNLLH